MPRLAGKIVTLCAAAFFIAGSGLAATIDFEDGDTSAWDFVDEDVANLGDTGPSTWEIRDSQLGLDGSVLFQGSNIWGSPGDTMLLGTQAVYTGEAFGNFVLEMDIAADDNDAMGLVWAYTGTDRHYRVNIINDRWPSPPLDGNSGPMAIMHKRVSNDDPWYELLSVIQPPEYVDYPTDGSRIHRTLRVEDGTFQFTSDHGIALDGQDSEYTDGFIGIQLYAQQSEFDNLVVTPLGGTAVDAQGKRATAWSRLKEAR